MSILSVKKKCHHTWEHFSVNYHPVLPLCLHLPCTLSSCRCSQAEFILQGCHGWGDREIYEALAAAGWRPGRWEEKKGKVQGSTQHAGLLCGRHVYSCDGVEHCTSATHIVHIMHTSTLIMMKTQWVLAKKGTNPFDECPLDWIYIYYISISFKWSIIMIKLQHTKNQQNRSAAIRIMHAC